MSWVLGSWESGYGRALGVGLTQSLTQAEAMHTTARQKGGKSHS